MIAIELSQTRTLTIRAAIIEHLRWEAHNIPSTVGELADGIGRNRSSVRRVIRELLKEGALAQFSGRETRYMLVEHSGPGARLLQ